MSGQSAAGHGAAASTMQSAAAAGLALRIAAMVYDGVLTFGIAFGAALLLLALAGWSAPLTGLQRLALQTLVFAVLGAYFGWCWHRSGQTLALKTWGLRVVDASGRAPSLARALGRYLLAWSLFLPGLAYIALMRPNPASGVAAVIIGFMLTLLPAVFDRERRLLHDRLSRTRIVRAR